MIMAIVISQAEAVVEKIGSPVGKQICKARVKKDGIKVKAEGTPIELLTVAASIIENIRLSYEGVTLEDIYLTITEMIMGKYMADLEDIIEGEK